MIAGIKGTVELLGPDHVIVGVGGVSLRVFAPTSTLGQVGAVGETVRLHTHLYLREDNLALYGFATADELRLFELLLGVTGIGPRAALSLLSALPPRDLAAAIASGNADRLTHVPGIGKKTAGRLILELKGKVESQLAAGTVPAPTAGQGEVIAALVALGFSAAEAASAAAAAGDTAGLGTEEHLRLALRQLAAR